MATAAMAEFTIPGRVRESVTRVGRQHLVLLGSLLLALAVCDAHGTAAFRAAPSHTDPELEALLLSRVAVASGTFGVAVKDLSSGRTAYVNAD